MTLPRIFAFVFLLCVPVYAFAPSNISGWKATTTTTTTTSILHVSVVKKFLTNEEAESKINNAFETQTPDSVGINEITNSTDETKVFAETSSSKRRRRRNRRKHNFSQKRKFLKEKPDLDFYTLHSSAISHLEKDMPINDIIRAIKRAQNLHDVHDLGTIAGFLIDNCDENWGYGFRGSLLSRLAVAALHMNEIDVATRAINTRRVHERPSMQPYESAAIVRGLMRANQIELAWGVLEDELRLPLEGTDLTSEENKEILKHRARTLASIASRHFYSGEPYISAKALSALGDLGGLIDESHMGDGELDMPWPRLVNAASDCKVNSCIHVESDVELPSDLTELVFNAIAEFPCPGGEEECSIEDFFHEED